jgi:hypothetical protein
MNETISRRNLFRRELRPLHAAVSAAIAQADPIRFLELGAPGDEYAQEVEAIVPRLAGATSVEDVRAIVHAEFASRFGDEIAGDPERYDQVASAIWMAMTRPR